MPDKPFITIDPDGSQGQRLHLIVAHPTGVRYSNQCGGYLCAHPCVEGFLIPLGQFAIAQELYDFFDRHFQGHGYPGSMTWSETALSELRSIVARVVCWRTFETHRDEVEHLELDDERIEECMEAWIPVRTPYGQGFITLENSD